MPVRKVFFATNRNPVIDRDGAVVGFGSDLGPVSGHNLRFGCVDVSVDVGKEKTKYLKQTLSVAPENLVPNPTEPVLLGSRTIFDQLRVDMKAGARPTLAFIHGYSNGFREAMSRAAWIIEFYGIDANIFAFSWPSVAAVGPVPLPFVDYIHDRSTAQRSGVALARLILILQDFVDGLAAGEDCRQPIHLLCHSMGNFVLSNGIKALQQLPPPTRPPAAQQDGHWPGDDASPGVMAPTLSGARGGLRRIFDQIILAAADEDDDAFDHAEKLKYLPRMGRAVTVYHTREDWILNTLSRRTKFNGPRLGVDGPDNMGSISDKVSAIDVSDVITIKEEVQGHQYYRTYPAVRDDIVAVLSGKRPDAITGRKAVSSGRWRLKKASDAPAQVTEMQGEE